MNAEELITKNKLDRIVTISNAMPEQKSEEWLEFRKGRLTGSDTADALGIGFGKGSARKSLLYRKCGHDPNPFKGNEYTRWGNLYEPVAQKAYELHTGKTVIELNIVPFPEEIKETGFLAYSPDGIAVNGEHGNPVLIEIKCPAKRKIIPGQVPHYYYPQIQLGLNMMYLYGIDTHCDFIQFKPGPEEDLVDHTLDITRVERDPKWWDLYFPSMQKFWNEVLHYRENGIRTHPGFVETPNVLSKKVIVESCGFLTSDSE